MSFSVERIRALWQAVVASLPPVSNTADKNRSRQHFLLSKLKYFEGPCAIAHPRLVHLKATHLKHCTIVAGPYSNG